MKIMKPTAYRFDGHLVAKEPLATCAKDLKDRASSDGPTPIPSITRGDGSRSLYFPATGIAGTLRRKALKAVHGFLQAHTGSSTPLSLDEHYMNTLGGIKGAGAEDKSTVQHEATVRAQNPILSLFGAGDAGFIGFMTSNLEIANAIAPSNVKPHVFNGARSNLFYRDAESRSWLSDGDLDLLVQQAEGGSDASKIKAAVKKLKIEQKRIYRTDPERNEAIDAEVLALEAEIKVIEKETGAKENAVGRPLAGYSTIPMDTVMSHQMRLFRSNDIELGLVIAALNEWAMEPVIGAHRARGCGMVSVSYEVSRIEPTGLVNLGTLTMTPFEPVIVDGDELKRAQQAFIDFMESKTYSFAIPTQEALTTA